MHTIFWCSECFDHRPSGVTRVGDTRRGNWGCHPSIFSWKTWRPFLVASSAVSSLVSSSLFFSKPGDLFLLIAVTITIAFYCFHSGVTPPGCHVSPHTFFYLSDLVSRSPLFFVNLPTKFFSFWCHPWTPPGVTHQGRSAPHSSDATAQTKKLWSVYNADRASTASAIALCFRQGTPSVCHFMSPIVLILVTVKCNHVL